MWHVQLWCWRFLIAVFVSGIRLCNGFLSSPSPFLSRLWNDGEGGVSLLLQPPQDWVPEGDSNPLFRKGLVDHQQSDRGFRRRKGGMLVVNSIEYSGQGWYSPQTEATVSLLDGVVHDVLETPRAPGKQAAMKFNLTAEEVLNDRTQILTKSVVKHREGLSRDQDEADEAESDNKNGWSKRRQLVEDFEVYDEVWENMRTEAKAAAEREPLLVSFIYSTILNQKTLEAALAFHMANKLSSVNMRATQVQELFRECLTSSPERMRSLRRDIIAVRERDPACTSYHDALLYFKGFQALQTHRVAHWLYCSGRQSLAYYLQSQVNEKFQIDIHPKASFGEGVFIDHGTGIVIGETATIGNDVSMLHLVTLGGSGKDNTQRHPQVGDGVLIGAGACLLGNIYIGDGAQIGACSLVLEDVPSRCVAVGVPAKVLGRTRVKEPAKEMRQELDYSVEKWAGMNI